MHPEPAGGQATLAEILEAPSTHFHPTLGEPGFTMPDANALEVYDLDDPMQLSAVTERHRVKVASNGLCNKLAIHRDLQASKLTVTYQAGGALCVLGRNAAIAGRLRMNERTCVVVAGGEQTRALSLDFFFQGRGQKLFWGSGATAQGVHTSMRGDGVAVIVGDDCMASWDVWFRPSDMHPIVDLHTYRTINAAADIVIGPHVWIGQQVLILKGARIGAGSILGARSLVPRGDYDRMSVYAGNPARKLRDGVTWDRQHPLTAAGLERVRAVQAAYAVPTAAKVRSPR